MGNTRKFTNNNLSDNLYKAVYTNDLFSTADRPIFVSWDGSTKNTPFKAGLTDCQEGFAFISGAQTTYMTVVCFAKNDNRMWIWSKLGNDWIEFARKEDLSAHFIDMSSYTRSDLEKTWETQVPVVGSMVWDGTFTPDKQTGFVFCAFECAIGITLGGGIYMQSSAQTTKTWEKLN